VCSHRLENSLNDIKAAALPEMPGAAHWLDLWRDGGNVRAISPDGQRRVEQRQEPRFSDCTMKPIPLPGCAPTPLAHYLKALGVLRLLAEQLPSELPLPEIRFHAED